MWKKYNKYRVLRLFFEDPYPEGIGFQLREMSRKINLAPKSVSAYLDELERERLIIRKPHRIHGYPVYYANMENASFKLYKRLDTISLLYETGLVEHLLESLMPDCIVLFGSASRGEDGKDSDIDLFVQCKETRMNLDKFEKKLKRKINIFFSKSFKDLSDELKNNIANGIVLEGFLGVF